MGIKLKQLAFLQCYRVKPPLMQLVIVESPAKAKTINAYLGKDYKVVASFGHVRALPSKDGSVRPEEDFATTYEISEDSVKHVAAMVKEVKAADTLILATDPDREGEAISWHILEALKDKKALGKIKSIQRVTFHEITKKSILDAVAHPREIDMDLVQAQQARQALDYLVGFKLSPVLWRKLPGARSAGRVQSVALRIICDRESEIEAFRAQEYWSIGMECKNVASQPFHARLTQFDGDKIEKMTIGNEAQATAITKALNAKQYIVGSVEAKQQKRNPYAPFTTSTLQQEASRKLGFSTKKTMQLAQKLYEGVELGGETVGLITYMRTDGVSVSTEAVHKARNVITADFGANFVPEKPRIYQTKQKNAQEAHEAIRPTDPAREPKHVAKHLDNDSLRLYELIWKRMLASQMESAIMDIVQADIASTDGKATFRASGSTVRFAGFLALYIEDKDDDEDEESRRLPELKEGETVAKDKIEQNQHFTEPPPRFSEASLVKKLEELGIGRPSTYSSIISVLQDRQYVKLEKKRFFPEPRGRIVTAFLSSFFAKYVSYDFTAKLEEELDDITTGEVDWKQVLRDFWQDFSKNIGDSKDLEIPDIMHKMEVILDPMLFPNGASHECPTCKTGKLGLKMSRYGAFIGCSNYPECRYTKPLDATNTGEAGAGNEVKSIELAENIAVKKGPYGWYVQQGSGKEVKRVSIPAGYDPLVLKLEQAKALLTLPRIVGNHPETGKPITASIGRFGPYIEHEKKYVNLKTDDVLAVGINRAVDLLASKPERGAGRTAVAPLRVLGAHPDGGDLAVLAGSYGPYIKWGKVNATLPKSTTPELITLEEAIELVNKKAASPSKKKPARGGRKKSS